MIITNETAQLISDLEEVIGNTCYNGDSYNGWTKEYGAHFRYPVTYIGNDGARYKTKGRKTNINLNRIEQMRYKFGANQLYIGRGIRNLLEELEDRFDIDFEDLLTGGTMPMTITVKKEICEQDISWFKCSKKVMNYLNKHEYKTVGDVIKQQDKLPQTYWRELKILLGYEFFDVKFTNQ